MSGASARLLLLHVEILEKLRLRKHVKTVPAGIFLIPRSGKNLGLSWHQKDFKLVVAVTSLNVLKQS